MISRKIRVARKILKFPTCIFPIRLPRSVNLDMPFVKSISSQFSIHRNLKAFIWDSSRLEYEAARDCDLITAGDLFGRSGYGVGLQKGSPWADKITLAILDFHESGVMEQLGMFLNLFRPFWL